MVGIWGGVNVEHQLKSKLAWAVCTKSMKLNKNGAETLTKVKNQVSIGLLHENFCMKKYFSNFMYIVISDNSKNNILMS